VYEAILGDVSHFKEDVNAAIFHQLKDNLPCQGMGEEVETGPSKKSDPIRRGH
jgi:hypothetical protein